MATEPAQYIVDSDELSLFVRTVFTALDFSEEMAETFADNLIDANLRGKDSHGVVRLPHYVKRIEAGGMRRQPNVSIESPSNSTLLVDGDGGPGQIASQAAVEAGIESAKNQGVCAVGVVNSNHFGTVSYYTNQAAEEGFAGIGISHGGPIVTPYGGTEKRLSTNPMSIGAPHETFPVNVDFSTSATSLGDVLLAESENRSIPSDWAINEDGEPTTDPAEFFALRPMAGHKGYGLSFLIDVLCGVMLSGQFGSEVSGLYDDIESPQELAHLFIFIDIESFVPLNVFKERISHLVTEIKETKTRESADIEEVMVPGERSHNIKQERLGTGIPIQASVWEDLIDLSETYSVKLPDAETS